MRVRPANRLSSPLAELSATCAATPEARPCQIRKGALSMTLERYGFRIAFSHPQACRSTKIKTMASGVVASSS